MVFLIQFLKITVCGICCVIVNNRKCFWVYNTRTVVWIPVKELWRILYTEISPILAKHCIRDNCCTILHCRVCFRIRIKQFKILIKGLNLWIICPFQYTRLHPECFIIMRCCFIFTINILESIHPINMAVLLPKFIPFFICIKFFNIWIFINIIIPSNQGSGIIKGCHCITAIYKIRIFSACYNRTNRFTCSLSCQPSFFYFHICFLCN